MDWELILKYQPIIKKIAAKYSGDPDLADDVTHEVMIKLFEDKKLDVNKFNPSKRDAAIRNTIRNKTLKVLRSRKIGRWTFDSLDVMQDLGYQIDDSNKTFFSPQKNDGRENDFYEWYNGDNNADLDSDD